MSNEPDEIENALEAATGATPPGGPVTPGAYDWGIQPGTAVEPRDNRVLQSIETLWAKHPYIGDGNHVIHVTRLEPQKWKGDSICGLIDDKLTDELTSMEFRERYGGGKYKLQVCGYAGGGGVRKFKMRGEPMIITCPGKPNPKYFFTTPEEPEDMGTDITSTLMAHVLKGTEAEQKKAMEAFAAARGENTAAFDGAMRLSSERVAEVRNMHEGVIASLRDDLATAKNTISQLEDKVRSLQEENNRVVREADTRIANEDMRRVKESRELHEQVVRDLSHKHEEELRRIREDAAVRSADARARWDDQLSQLRSQFDSERSSLNGRIDQIRSESSQRILDETRRLDEMHRLQAEQSRQTYEARISDITRSHESEIRTLTASHAAQLSSARDVATIQITSNDAVTKQHITMLRQRTDEMSAELNRLRDENNDLREEKYKPAHVAVAEARALLDELSPQVEEKTEEKKDWKQQAVEMAPALIGMVAQRLSNPPTQVVPTGTVQTPPQSALPQGRQQPQSQQYPGARRRPMRPVGYDPADYPVAVSAPPRPYQQGPLRPRDGGPGPGPVAPPAAPSSPPSAPTVEPPVVQPTMGTPVQESAPTAATSQETQTQSGQADNGNFQMFATQLESAFQRSVPPETVAAEFVKLAGQEQAAQVMQAVSPVDVIEFLKRTPGDKASALTSFRGKKYLEAIWVAARSLLVH